MLSIISCADHQEVPKALQSTNNAAVDTVAIVNDPTTNVNIQASSFTEIDSSGILMFPLAPGERESNESSESYRSAGNRFWNVIFLNSKTNEYHLLSEKKLLIRSFDLQYTNGNDVAITPTNRHIF